MPPKYVNTIREEILYEYAKLMSGTVFKGKLDYGFITDRFKALQSGEITMSGTIREWQREQELLSFADPTKIFQQTILYLAVEEEKI